MATLQTFYVPGWFSLNSEGIATIYLSNFEEGMITSPTDTPANTQYRPRLLNLEQFSIKRAPPVWVYGATTVQGAAFGQLQIDNYDGAFDFLVSADLRDTPVILKLPPAGALQVGTAINSSLLVATGVIDNVTADSEDIVTLTFKDAIARLDKPLPAMFNPPFVDAGAANTMIPLTFGAFRSVMPQLINSALRQYRLHDVAIANVATVMDKAAPLDPSANPPQYTSAFSGAGLQLQTLPQGLLLVDGCSVGLQAPLPGIQDVLAGSGAFPGTWTGTGGSSTTTTSGACNSATHTIPVAVAGTQPPDPFNGQWIFVNGGANTLYAQIVSGAGTATLTYSTVGQVVVGVVNSIATSSPVTVQGAPASWTWSGLTGSAPAKLSNPPYGFLGSNNAAALFSSTAFNPGGASYGEYLATSTAVLQPGSTYRLTFGLYNVQAAQPYYTDGMLGGVMVSTALSNIAQDYVTGYFQPLNTTAFQSQNFTFEFTVPAGAARKLYFIIAPSSGSVLANPQGTCNATLFNVKLEQLGQFVAQPLSAMSFTNYCTEILVNRAGESVGVFSTADTDAIGIRDVATVDTLTGTTYPVGSLIPFGCHFDTQPNILDTLRMPADCFLVGLATDSSGVLRFRRLTDPSNPVGRVIKADFNAGNMQRPISIVSDNPTGLTNLFGARRNWKVPSDSDFVTDQLIVPQDRKIRLMRASQYQLYSTRTPASQYSFAIGAAIFDTVLDIPADVQNEGDRVVGIWSPNAYADGTTNTGKRRIVTFTTFFDDPLLVGATIQTPMTNFFFGDIISITYPTPIGTVRFNNTPAAILQWEIFPYAQKIAFTVLV